MAGYAIRATANRIAVQGGATDVNPIRASRFARSQILQSEHLRQPRWGRKAFPEKDSAFRTTEHTYHRLDQCDILVQEFGQLNKVSETGSPLEERDIINPWLSTS